METTTSTSTTTFILNSGGTVQLSAPAPEPKKRLSQIVNSKAGKLGVIALFLIAAVLFSHYRKGMAGILDGRHSGSGSSMSNDRQSGNTPHYTVIADGKITVSEGEWSEPPITVERNQGIDAMFVEGNAVEYMVRDADHPEVIYPYSNGTVINTDGNRLHRRQWKVSGVTQAPVRLRFTVYQ